MLTLLVAPHDVLCQLTLVHGTEQMSDTNKTTRKRLSHALRAGQEPIDRLWAAIYVLILIVVLVGITTVYYAESNQNYQGTTRVLGFERGSVDCLSVVIDNDRDFDIPPYCRRSEIVVYYPSEVCEAFFAHSDICSKNWEEG